jgi:hypothetical protein
VADDDGPIRAQRRDQPGNVGGQVLDRVGIDGVRLVAAAITAHVRRGHPVARLRQCRNLMAPRIPALGKAVDQDDQRSVSRQRHAQPDAAGVDDLQIRFHAIRRAYSAATGPPSRIQLRFSPS